MSPSRRIFVSQILEGIMHEQAEHLVEDDGSDEHGADLKISMANLHSLLSPIHQLPPELLVNIFRLICASTELRLSETPQIVALTSVCGRWRETALSTPSLWADISFESTVWLGKYRFEPNNFEKNLPGLVQVVRLFLARSQTAPLDLSLGLHSFDEQSSPNMVDLMDLIATTKDRWRNVVFSFAETLLDQLEHPSSGQLCRPPPLSLESLTLALLMHRPLPGMASDSRSLLQGFESCPSLTSLSLTASAAHYWSRFSLPWRQITKLQISDIDTSSLAEMLKDTPGLKELCVSSITPTPNLENELRINPISLVMLERLDLEYRADVPSILRHFTFPRLTSLLLHCDEAESPWNHSHFTEFLERSSCTVTHLRIGEFSGPGLDILRLFPRLESLRIEETVLLAGFKFSSTNLFTEAFLCQLFELILTNPDSTRSSSPLPYLPQLTDLTLMYLGTDLDIDHLVNAISTSPTPWSVSDRPQRRNLRLDIEYIVKRTRRSEDELMPSMELEVLENLRDVVPGVSLRVEVFRNRDDSILW
ncbi:hypothetical protein PM082_018053 [Marasmius tenuissimus]|nr:hypothetical protein PM082_018053 [Marasmius tenuissimus]